MIKMPKEVKDSINKLSKEGFVAYAVGGCVRDSLLGEKPIDWDLCTDADLDSMVKIFPKARVLNQNLEVIRLDFTKDENDLTNPIVDIARLRVEGAFDEKGNPTEWFFTKDIMEDLKRRDFTINAIAYNHSSSIVEIPGGREDLKNKIIKTVYPAEESFRDDPLRMLRCARFTAEKDFLVDEAVFNAMKDNSQLLLNISKDKLRGEFEKLVDSTTPSKGFKLLFDTGLIFSLSGVRAEEFKLKKKIMLSKFIRNIDKVQDDERRLMLYYGLLGKRRLDFAFERLNYPGSLRKKIKLVTGHIEILGTIKNPLDLKEFINRIGYENYYAMENLAQDKVLVYGGSSARVNKRRKLFQRIKDKAEPVMLGDLAINGGDLLDEGIDDKSIGTILYCLLLDVHKKPFLNNRGSLLKLAKAYEKSSLKRLMKTNSFLKRFR